MFKKYFRLKDSDRYMPYSSQEGYGNSSMKDISIFLTRRKFGPAGQFFG